MNELLNKFVSEMVMRNYSENTIRTYESLVKLFLVHFNQSPREINEDEIKVYIRQSSSISLLKQRIGSIKLFYKLVVHQPLKFRYIQYPRREAKLPVVLTPGEVARLIGVVKNIKHKAIIMLFYSTGMREAELLNLKMDDIDSNRMVIKINSGKGKKDRFVPLSTKMLELLRDYYREYHPVNYLFNGQFSDRYSGTSIRNLLKRYARMAGINKRIYPHLLRHCSATHLYENGTDISVIQRILGHKSQRTTQIYAHMSTQVLSKVTTPDMIL